MAIFSPFVLHSEHSPLIVFRLFGYVGFLDPDSRDKAIATKPIVIFVRISHLLLLLRVSFCFSLPPVSRLLDSLLKNAHHFFTSCHFEFDVMNRTKK